MLGIADYLNAHARPGSHEVAVAVRFRDPHAGRANMWAYRPLALLIDEPMRVAPLAMDAARDREQILDWARANGARFLLTRPPEPTSRIWHFRRPLLGRDPAADPPRYYELFELRAGQPVRIDPPPAPTGLTRVPGL